MISITDAWDSAISDHKKYVLDIVKKKLEIPVGEAGYVKCGYLRDFVEKNKDVIACGKPITLKGLVQDYEGLKARLGGPRIDLFKFEARQIFNYKNFANKKVRLWCAYFLCMSSSYKICPYCNQNYAFTLAADDGEFRPTLDHFYSKSEYPFLAISLYNLIPSCYTCNSNLKGAKNFFDDPHLHPFEANSDLEFRVKGKGGVDINRLIGDEHLFCTSGEVRPVEVDDDAKNNSIKTFLLNDRFEFNESDFLQFAYYRKQLTSERVKEIEGILKIPTNASSLLRFEPKNHKNTIHGKIYFDIFNQFRPD